MFNLLRLAVGAILPPMILGLSTSNCSKTTPLRLGKLVQWQAVYSQDNAAIYIFTSKYALFHYFMLF
jgi:hypothetical protein